MILPTPLADVSLPLAPAFTAPTFGRFALLAIAPPLTTGRRTGAHLLRTPRCLAPGHRTGYQRVPSAARWPCLTLACCPCRLVLRLLPADRPVLLVGGDTVDGRKGQRVWGKARHRDPVRSTKSYAAWRCGHRRVVLVALAHPPFAKRPRALPALVTPYRSAEGGRREGRPHRTPAQLLGRLAAVLLRWPPERRSVPAGDAGCGAHEGARFCPARRERLTLVSKPHPEANLFGPPPPYTGKGRPRAGQAEPGRGRRPAAAGGGAPVRRRRPPGGAGGRHGPLVQVGPRAGAAAPGVRHGGAPLAVAVLGFPTGRGRHGRPTTPRAAASARILGPGACRLKPGGLHQSN